MAAIFGSRRRPQRGLAVPVWALGPYVKRLRHLVHLPALAILVWDCYMLYWPVLSSVSIGEECHQAPRTQQRWKTRQPPAPITAARLGPAPSSQPTRSCHPQRPAARIPPVHYATPRTAQTSPALLLMVRTPQPQHPRWLRMARLRLPRPQLRLLRRSSPLIGRLRARGPSYTAVCR